MHTDVISYKLAEGKTEEELLAAADAVLDQWMSKLDGFVSWTINKTDDGYTDLVVWESVEHAKAAEQTMNEIPQELSGQWYGCYDFTSISTNKLTQLKHYAK